MPDPRRRDGPVVRAPEARPSPSAGPRESGPGQVLVPAPTAPKPSQPAQVQAQAKATPVAKPARAKTAGASVQWIDVAACSALVVAGAFAAFALPVGPLRLALALPVLLFAPGFLLLQACIVPAPRGTALLWQGLASVGLSPAIVGLLALSTAIVQGGFKLGAIVALVTLGGLALAATAVLRRRALARSATNPDPMAAAASRPVSTGLAASPAPEAARAKSGTVRP